MMHMLSRHSKIIDKKLARLNHSDAKYFKAQAIKHNRQKFISLQTKKEMYIWSRPPF